MIRVRVLFGDVDRLVWIDADRIEYVDISARLVQFASGGTVTVHQADWTIIERAMEHRKAKWSVA